jgi:hypothetical protein
LLRPDGCARDAGEFPLDRARQSLQIAPAAPIIERTVLRPLADAPVLSKDVELPMLLAGIKANTSPTDYYPLQSLRMARFEGETWHLFGEVISAEAPGR